MKVAAFVILLASTALADDMPVASGGGYVMRPVPVCSGAQKLVYTTGSGFSCATDATGEGSSGPATDVQCAGACVASGEIEALATSKLTGSVADAQIAALTTSKLVGSVADAQLASNYSGVGACGAGQFVSTLNDNGAPTCGTPAGGGGGPTVVRVAAPVANSTTTFADVTGLTKAVLGGVSYAFACELTYTTAINTTALQLATNGPAMTALDYSVQVATTATAWHLSAQTAHDTNTNPATGAAAVRLPARVTGSFTPSAGGTFALRLRSEISASAVTVQRGSWCEFHTL